MDTAPHCNFVTFYWTNASGRWSFEGNFNSLIVITWELTGSLPFCLMPKCKLISWLHSQKMMKCEHLKRIHRLWIYRTANYSIIWEKYANFLPVFMYTLFTAHIFIRFSLTHQKHQFYKNIDLSFHGICVFFVLWLVIYNLWFTSANVV